VGGMKSGVSALSAGALFCLKMKIIPYLTNI